MHNALPSNQRCIANYVKRFLHTSACPTNVVFITFHISFMANCNAATTKKKSRHRIMAAIEEELGLKREQTLFPKKGVSSHLE